MFLFSYVDITEAIDTSDASFMDNSEYQDADGLPLNGPMPTTHYLKDEVRFHTEVSNLNFSFMSSIGYVGCSRRCAYLGAVCGN